MSNRYLMAGEWVDPQTGQLRSLYDYLGYPICVNCKCRIIESYYCQPCLELITRDGRDTLTIPSVVE